ncbi:inactive transglutaminase family protein [Rubritalea tangerina]|uniref:Inactive transglutaminase family protein n=1 Tax=Rubritalea tangerina TaxID=430798 RepID=A0ABW4Z885_9BACT
MKAGVQLRVVIICLSLIGVGLALFKHLSVGYPFFPREKSAVWTIEAKINFEAKGEAVKVRFAVPGEQRLYGVLEESGASSDYGFIPAVPPEDGNSVYRTVTWAKEKAEGPQELYYRVNIFSRTVEERMRGEFEVVELDPAYTDGPVAVAADEVIATARKYSADMPSFTSKLNETLASDTNQNVQTLMAGKGSDLARTRVLLNLLLKAGYEAHLVRYIELGESASRVPLKSAVFVRHEGDRLLSEVGEIRPVDTERVLAWQRGGPALVELQGGKNAKVSFSVMEQQLPSEFVQQQSAMRSDKGLVDFSLLSLSIEQQNAYRLLLMIPFGALVVVVMRNIIGVKTSGTFMPILLAMAFLKTDLLPGICLFVVVVSSGLVVRSYLSKLDLLLVPRISAVVVVVIGIMVSFGILGSKFEVGLVQSVTLFPTIILAWTVERLSILWEEDGAREVAVQTGGSLIVALMAYAVMGNGMLRYQVFIFPEILLVVLAVILALGQYAGYRVSELIRFAPFFDRQKGGEA